MYQKSLRAELNLPSLAMVTVSFTILLLVPNTAIPNRPLARVIDETETCKV